MDPSSLLAAAGDEQRASRICTFRMHVAAGRLAAWRLPESDAERVQWCVDGWEAVAAEVSAELGISPWPGFDRRRAWSYPAVPPVPKLAEVCLTGAVDFRVFRLIQFRTGLVTRPRDPRPIGHDAGARGPAVEQPVGGEDDRADRLASHQLGPPRPNGSPKTMRDDRYVDIRPDAHGMATISGSLPAADGAVVDARVEAIASTVCAKDPRTKRARRVDAMVAMSEGATTLTCNCNTSDCTAKGSRDATPSQVVIYVIAEEATVSGSGTTPGYLPGFGAVPAETVRNLATRAKIRPLARPQDLSAETSYRPSRKLAEFVDYRDLTCRFPGCTTVAQRCDTDHTVPYPLGPTHPSDLKLYCPSPPAAEDLLHGARRLARRPEIGRHDCLSVP